MTLAIRQRFTTVGDLGVYSVVSDREIMHLGNSMTCVYTIALVRGETGNQVPSVSFGGNSSPPT